MPGLGTLTYNVSRGCCAGRAFMASLTSPRYNELGDKEFARRIERQFGETSSACAAAVARSFSIAHKLGRSLWSVRWLAGFQST